MDGRALVELAHDVQSGLGNIDVPDFERMRMIGMASTLAMHVRGLGEIRYEILRKVSDHYFGIPSFALKDVVTILAEVEYVQIISTGSRIDSIIPDVPRFQEIYDGLGEYFSFSDLNEYEQGTLSILATLQKRPENKDRLIHAVGLDRRLLDRCIQIGSTGHYVKEYRARGQDISWFGVRSFIVASGR